MNKFTVVFLIWTILLPAAVSSDSAVPAPDNDVKCPVCGMFVARYPDWVASITFGDGSVFFFDGVKDMFKYLFNLGKYNPGKKQSDLGAIYVTEYYGMKSIAGRRAFYVMGSEVYGPMGRELIPLASEEDARGFKKDHGGRRILRFEEITPAVIKRLD